MRTNRTTQIVIIANLTALSVLFYFTLKFPLPFFPSFLDIQFSNLPAVIGGFAMGPVAGSLVVVLRTLIKLPFSSTAMVGELIDLIIGVSTVVVSSLIYKKVHSRKGAVLGMVAGALTWTVVAVAANYFFVLDFYVEFYFGGNAAGLVGMLSMIPGITEDNFKELYVIYTAIPFNLLLSTLVYLITFLVYKRISVLIQALNQRFTK